jgi:RNA polymerase I-specific transcription initiation factor RRN6
MAKPNPIPNDLNYGHFGQAVYDTETSTWSFGRVPGQRELQHLPTWEANGLPVEQPETAPLDHTCKVRDIRQASKALGRSHPDIVPAIGLLPELAVASTAVTCTASTYDPAVGQLLSFGSITLGKTHQDYPRRVAALPTGEGGGILKVVILSRERHGWVPNRTLWLEESCIHEGESGYWAADAAPILQVCFAQSNSRSAFLAVRSHTKTVLFRPCHYAERKPAVRSRFYELPASRVDPYPVASISFERTGGTPHADVTFNPDYQRQIGIIDQKGNWTIWDIEGGYKGVSKKHTLTCIVTGSMVSQIEADSKELDSREDGWARILWVGDVNTVVVCTRRQLEVYGVKAGKPELLQCPDLIPRHSADWVLDIKRHPKNRHQFCVLTSTRLFLMAVTTQSDDFGTSTVAGAAIALSWVHFRGMDDITLQMSLLGTADRGKASCVVYSGMLTILQIFLYFSPPI